jgi:hypothetical protein
MELKTNFARELKRLEESCRKISYAVIQKFQLEPQKVFHSQGRGVSLLNQ